MVWASGYTAFGQSVGQSGSTVNHYGWGAGSGYRSDGFGPTGAASVMKVGFRYYDPEFGCFLSRDTDLDQSPYGYCDGDPVNFTDPSGHDKKHKPQPGQGSSGAPTPKGPGAPRGTGGSGGAGLGTDIGKGVKQVTEGVAQIIEATHASFSGKIELEITHVNRDGSYTTVKGTVDVTIHT